MIRLGNNLERKKILCLSPRGDVEVLREELKIKQRPINRKGAVTLEWGLSEMSAYNK